MQPRCSSGDNAFLDCIATTGRPGRQSGRGECASGRWIKAAISRTGCGDAGTESAGDGVFSCGRPGHGVNRCSRVDTSFAFLPRGWLVDIRETRDGPGGRVSPPDHR